MKNAAVEVKKSKAYQQLASDPDYKKAAESSSDATRYLVKELLAKAVEYFFAFLKR